MSSSDELRESAFGWQRFAAPIWLPKAEGEKFAAKQARHYYAGFDADTSVDCLLSWRYGPVDSKKAIVYAGLPVRQTFNTLPAIGDVLTFTPILVALYGAGKEMPQEPKTAKVVAIETSYSDRFDFTVTLEVIRDEAEDLTPVET